MNAPITKALTTEELSAEINRLQAQIAQLQSQLAEIQGKPAAWCHDFKANLKIGDSGNEVAHLHTALQKDGVWSVTGFGNTEFDEETASYIVAFQEKYKDEILAPIGLKNGTGFVGSATRKKLNELYGCGITLPSCQMFWWSDNDHIYCQEKQFCGAYMYFGLHAFKTQTECEADLAKPLITVFSPKGGEKLVIGETYDITWTSKGVEKIDIELNSWRADSAFGGPYGWTIVDNIPASLGRYSWTIPANIEPKTYPADMQKIKIVSAENLPSSVSGYSNGYFSIGTTTTNCTDFDGGKNYYLKGQTLLSTGANLIDNCPTNSPYKPGITLLEAYCANESPFVVYQEYECPNGCRDGACIPTSTTCSDYDGGKDYYVKSYGTGIYPINNRNAYYIFNKNCIGGCKKTSNEQFDAYEDHCYDNNQLNEAFCGTDGSLQAMGITCPNGCKDGACVLSTDKTCSNHAQCSQSCDDIGTNLKWSGIGSNYKSWTGACPSSIYGCMTGNCCLGQCNLQEGSCFCQRTNVVDIYGSVCPSGQTCGNDCYCHSSAPIGTEINPYDADVKTCIDSEGKTWPTIGEGSAAWFLWGGCAKEKYYEVTQGQELTFHVYTDSCPGCVCYFPNFYVYEYENGGWVQKKYLDLPDQKGLTLDEKYTPNSNKIKISASNCFYLDIYSPEPVKEKSFTVLSPNGGETWEIGKTYNITWKANGLDKVTIELTDWSCSSETPITIARNIPASQGSYSWKAPDNLFTSTADNYCPTYIYNPTTHYGWKSGDNFKIFVAEVKPTGSFGVQDESNNYFSIVSASSASCTDSDGGINFNVKGTLQTKDSISSGSYYDLCWNGGNELHEWSCNGAQAKETIYTCPNGCQNGACKPAPTSTIKYLENQLASVADAVSQLIEGIKKLGR